MDGIEQSLNIDLALTAVSVWKNLNAAARDELAVERVRIDLRSVIEEKFFGNLCYACVEQNILTVKDYDRVYDIFEVFYLMCGNHDCGILRGVLHQSLAELRLRRNVQPVGRLIHQNVAASARKRE